MSKEELEKRFQESIELARKCGVPEEMILHNQEEVDAFFMKKDSGE